ncbi:MAG: hypothetical protein M1819_004925 [Sarea resinae]|nr:MAG: hypothetical protein M1819_004925 [Sarea resinae]
MSDLVEASAKPVDRLFPEEWKASGRLNSTGLAARPATHLPRSSTRKPENKKGQQIFSFFSLKEPSAEAFSNFQDDVRKQVATAKGRPAAVGMPGVSLSRLPASVPKVNSKWNGLPKGSNPQEMSQRQPSVYPSLGRLSLLDSSDFKRSSNRHSSNTSSLIGGKSDKTSSVCTGSKEHSAVTSLSSINERDFAEGTNVLLRKESSTSTRSESAVQLHQDSPNGTLNVGLTSLQDLSPQTEGVYSSDPTSKQFNDFEYPGAIDSGNYEKPGVPSNDECGETGNTNGANMATFERTRIPGLTDFSSQLPAKTMPPSPVLEPVAPRSAMPTLSSRARSWGAGYFVGFPAAEAVPIKTPKDEEFPHTKKPERGTPAAKRKADPSAISWDVPDPFFKKGEFKKEEGATVNPWDITVPPVAPTKNHRGSRRRFFRRTSTTDH